MTLTNDIDNYSPITIDTIFNNNRTDDNRDDIHTERRSNSNILQSTGLPNVIYRYKFTEEFMGYLYNFSKIHQYDERKDFKEAWKVWMEENIDMIDDEVTRMLNLGYDGDVTDKMFKSARYYFRKKSTEKKVPKQRRHYISVPRELLNAMDIHIETNIYNDDYQPKTGFISFCKTNEKILKESISKIFEQGIRESGVIEDKIKKTYKNRYFIQSTTNKKEL